MPSNQHSEDKELPSVAYYLTRHKTTGAWSFKSILLLVYTSPNYSSKPDWTTWWYRHWWGSWTKYTHSLLECIMLHFTQGHSCLVRNHTLCASMLIRITKTIYTANIQGSDGQSFTEFSSQGSADKLWSSYREVPSYCCHSPCNMQGSLVTKLPTAFNVLFSVWQ